MSYEWKTISVPIVVDPHDPTIDSVEQYLKKYMDRYFENLSRYLLEWHPTRKGHSPTRHVDAMMRRVARRKARRPK